jgi:hypothetical protein
MAQATFAALPSLLGPPRVRRAAPGLVKALRELRRALQGLIDPYRPELHYMRGPGPKWREKHGRASAAGL